MTTSVTEIGEAERAEFEGYLHKWQTLLGLQRWRIILSKKVSKSCAECNFDSDASTRLVRILLGKDFGSEPVNSETLEATALHELLHVFLLDYKAICTTQPTEADQQMLHEHEIVHVLEKLLIELDKNARLSQELPLH